MPFPQTKEDLIRFLNDENSLSGFAKILQSSGLKPPSPKREADLLRYAVQPDDVRGLFERGRSYGKCLKTGWEYCDENWYLDKIIYLKTIKFGHVLNKLAEFNDKELEESFVAKMAAKLGETTEETRGLLQKFHVFTKTETISAGQRDAINIIRSMWEKKFNEILSHYSFDIDDFQFCCFFGKPVLPAGRCCTPGYPDFICFLRNVNNPKRVCVLIGEYDGTVKTPEQIEQRANRWQYISGCQVKVGSREIEGEVSLVKVVYGENKLRLTENFFSTLRDVISGEEVFRCYTKSSASKWLLPIIEGYTTKPYASCSCTGASSADPSLNNPFR